MALILRYAVRSDLGLVRHERLAHLIAVHRGQVAIEHDDVVAVDGHVGQRVGFVIRDVDRHAFAPESLATKFQVGSLPDRVFDLFVQSLECVFPDHGSDVCFGT